MKHMFHCYHPSLTSYITSFSCTFLHLTSGLSLGMQMEILRPFSSLSSIIGLQIQATHLHITHQSTVIHHLIHQVDHLPFQANYLHYFLLVYLQWEQASYHHPCHHNYLHQFQPIYHLIRPQMNLHYFHITKEFIHQINLQLI